MAGAAQLLIPVLIEMCAALVKAAVHFDDQAGGGSAEISDVTTDDDLATERSAETAAAQLSPQASFRSREMLAHVQRAASELMLTLRRLTTLIR